MTEEATTANTTRVIVVNCLAKTYKTATKSAIWRFIRTGIITGLTVAVTYVVAKPEILHLSAEWEAAIIVIGSAILAAWNKLSRDIDEIHKKEKEGAK